MNQSMFRESITNREARVEMARTELDLMKHDAEISEHEVRQRISRLPFIYNIIIGPLDREISAVKKIVLTDGYKLEANTLKAYHIALHHLEHVRILCGVLSPDTPVPETVTASKEE